MPPFTNRARQSARGLFFTAAFLLANHFGAANANALCPAPGGSNPIVVENCKPGNPQSEWDITDSGDATIQGFATDMSFNRGQIARFKIKTTALAYHIDIYRLGWYDGMGARKVDTILNDSTLKTNQDACLNDDNPGITTHLVDCGNWLETASWQIPADATSGIYIARPVREDTLGASHIVFIVRADGANADLLYQTSDTTWQAYNSYGNFSLYTAPQAYKVSYNRPFTTAVTNRESWLFGPEYPMIRFLERNGYDVSYFSGIDTARSPGELSAHKVFLSVGHDEYWSAEQRANVEAARDNGVHLAFFSGNDIYWKIRWENNFTGVVDGSSTFGSTPYRTLTCYKDPNGDLDDVKLDPMLGIWTGRWRDPRLGPHDGGRPENPLSGTQFMVSRGGTTSMDVPSDDARMRFWRNAIPIGGSANLAFGFLGYEWNEDPDNGLRPAGQIRLSTTVRSGVPYLRNFGSAFTPGTATHHLTLHRRPSGAMVFSAGTVQWTWGLDSNHNAGVLLPPFFAPPPDVRIQQATVNLLADMGVQPQSLLFPLLSATESSDEALPSSTITSPTSGAVLPAGKQITITGTASDTLPGVVGGVEVSTDDGTTWHPAIGRGNWTYKWTPTATGSSIIRSRAADDSLNLQTSVTGIAVNVVPAPPINCPCSIWSPTEPAGPQSDDGAAINVGVKFRSDTTGYITAIRFYKHLANTDPLNPHIGYLWRLDANGSGTLLAQATFVGESGSGWQEVPIPSQLITAGTTYIAAYSTSVGRYAVSQRYFHNTGVDNPPLHALAENVDGSNGVFGYGAPGTFPDQTFGYSNYWVDVVFNLSATDTTPPTVTATVPLSNELGVNVDDDITATFSEAMNGATINGGTFELRDASNNLIPASVTFTAATKTAVLHPTSILGFSKSYTATVKGGPLGVKDLAGIALAAPGYSWTFTAAADNGCPCSIWDDSIPEHAVSNDIAVNLGLKFRSDVDGYIKGLRFLKPLGTNGTTTGSLYNATGSQLLGSAVFPAGTPSGWQEVSFSPAVAINANTTYVAAYHTNGGNFAVHRPHFGSQVVNPPLRALANGFEGPNGVYVYGPLPAFPSDNPGDGPNYWVDVIFDTITIDHSAPVVTARSPAAGATVVARDVNVTATFNESVAAETITNSTFTLRDASSNLIAGDVTYNVDTKTATLDPSALLDFSMTYTATLLGGAGGVKDIAGNALAPPNHSWSFTIAAAPPEFAAGADVTVLEDSGPYNNPWATSITGGPDFLVSTTNSALFGTAPAISPAGVLSFTPAPNANGSATVTVVASNIEDTSSTPTSFTVTVTAVNDAPGFTAGANVVVAEDSGPYNATWATSISAGTNESAQTLSFTVTNDNMPIFAVQPAISPAGALTFTPAPNAHSTATITIRLLDDGGTANGGADRTALQTFTIQVTSVNDAPSFTKGADSRLLDTAGAQNVTGWATNLSAGALDEAGELLNFIVSNDNNALFSAQPQITSTGTLNFTPAVGQSGVAIVSVRIHDDGETDNGGVDTSALQTFTITVDNIPVITSGNATTFTVGIAGTFTLTTTGAPRPAIARGGVALPSGITFVDNGDGTGTLSGTPGSGTGGVYPITFTATNVAGSTAPQSFTLTINQAPAITSANSTAFTAGTAGSLTVTTTGFPAPSINRGGVALPSGIAFTDNGNGTATLSGTAATGTGGTYAITFTATNLVNSTPAQAFALTINAAPVITTSPANQTVCDGIAATFTATAGGFPAPTVQWQVSSDGTTYTDIPGAVSSTLTFTPVLADNGKRYRAVFTNSSATATTSAAVLTVNANPEATITPAPAAVCASSTGNTAQGPAGAATYAWSISNGTITSGQNERTVTFTAGATATVNLTLTVTNAAGCSATNTAPVTINEVPATPTIVAGTSTSFCAGGSVMLTSSSASGNQWYLNGASISGATSTTYAATATGNYTVIATANGCPSAASAATPVTVNATPATPTISAGGPTTFCQGGSVTLTSNSASGNQWYLNGASISGATSTTYAATATGSYTVIATANGCPSTASVATAVTVNATPATPTISAGGPTTFCAGGSVTLTSNSATGNQWYLNGSSISGATSTTYAATATGSYTVIATANGCPSAVSVATAVTVNATPATPTISAGGPTTFCAGGSVTLTSNSASGNQWYLNGASISGATSTTYAATATGNYTVIATANGCPSAASLATAVTVNATPLTPTISAGGPTTFCAGGSVTLTSNSASGNQWYLNGASISGATSTTYAATATGSYTVIATANGCPSAASVATAVTVNATPLTPTISAGGPITFCAGGSVTLTSNSATGNQWYLNGASISGATSTTYAATATGSYTVIATANGCPSTTSVATAVTVNATPATPSISAGGPTTFCAGGSVTLTSNSASGNQWYLNGASISGATSTTYAATATGSYTVIATANGCPSAASGPTPVTVTPAPATPTISAGGPITFCAGGSVTLTSNNATGNQWYLNGASISGATSTTYAATATGNYTVIATANGCPSAASVATAVTVNATPLTPTISAGGPTTFCAGGSVTLTSNSASGNQWYLNGASISGATSTTYAATATGSYTVIATANGCPSAASVATAVTVNATPPTPTISAGGPTTFCAGGSVTLTSNSASGNQWYLNGASISGATSTTYAATATGSYTVIATANGCPSAASLATAVTVNATPAIAPTISAGGPTTFCQGGSVTLTSSSAGDNQWFFNGSPIGGATNAQYVATASGDYTVAVTTNGCSSAASAATAVTVSAVPAAPSISAGGPTTFCQGGNVTLTSNSASGNQWYLNGASISGATNTTYAATATGSYTVIATANGCPSAASAATTVIVNAIPATPTISGPTSFCTGGSTTLSSSSATGNQWSLNGSPIPGETNQTYVATTAGNYTVIATANGCPSAASTATTVTVNAIPATPTISGPTSFCTGGSATLSSSTATGNQWSLNGSPIPGATNQTYIATAAGNYTVIVTANGCPSAASATTVVTMNATPPTPTISGPTSFCTGGSATLTSSSTSGNQWSLNGSPIAGATNQNYVATAAGNYTVIATANGCPSAASTATTVTVNAIPATPTISGPTSFCTGGSTMLTSSSANGNQWSLNGLLIPGATNQNYVATAGGNYTVIATANGCPSAPSAATLVTVNATPATPTISGPTSFCTGGSATLTSSSTSGNQWSLNGSPIAGATNQNYVATAAGNYTVIATANGCPSAASTATTVTVNAIPATPTISGPTSFCTGGSSTLSSSTATGNQWSLNGSLIPGATNQTYIATTAGNYTVVATANGCPSATSVARTLTVNAIPATPTISGPTSFCAGGSATLSSSSATGNQWSMNGSPIPGATNQNYVATAAGNYTVIATANGCPSAASVATTVTVNAIPATPTISGPTSFCAGGSATLSSSSATGNQWSMNGSPIPGATNQTYIATAAGNYTVIATANGCPSAASAATTVTVNAIPATPIISGPTSFCAGGSATLSSSSATGNQWSMNGSPIPGATNQSYLATAAGSYTVIATLNGCSSAPSTARIVTVNANPGAPVITAPIAVNANSTGNTASGPVGANTYAWSIANGTITGATNTQSITFSAGAAGNVTLNLSITNAAGCAAGSLANVPINSNNAPVAVNDSYTVLQNSTLSVVPRGVLINDTDADGNLLMAALVSDGTHGAATLNSDGSFTYIPQTNYYGSDTFTYRASDGIATSNLATVSITIYMKSVTQSVAAGGTITTDSEVDGATVLNPLETSVTLPTGVSGTVFIAVGKTTTADVPPAGFSYFNHQVDSTVNSPAPVATAANPLVFEFRIDSSIIPAGQNKDTVQVFRNGVPVAECGAGAGTSASPDPCIATRALVGDDISLTVRTSNASKWNCGSSTANTPAVAANDSYDALQDTPFTVAAPGILANDTDADKNTLSAVLVVGPAHASSFTLNSNGSFTYTPAATYFGPDGFTYKANDGKVDSNVATVNITVKAKPAVSVSDVSVTEGNSGTLYATFQVTLSSASSVPVVVTYGTASGTALSGEDFYARASTLTFQPGTTLLTVSVQLRPDVKYELNEQFYLNLSAATNATIADSQGIGTIVNDDLQPKISINSVTAFEANAATTNFTFTVSLSNPSYQDITVTYATANGTGTAGSDYIAASGILTIPAGSTSRTIAVLVNGDTAVEPNETFTLNLSSPTNATILVATGTGTILNND